VTIGKTIGETIGNTDVGVNYPSTLIHNATIIRPMLAIATAYMLAYVGIHVIIL